MTFSLEELLAIFAFSLVASISPGPVNLLILSTGVGHGWRRAMPLVVGASGGFTLLLGLLAAGLGSVWLALPGLQWLVRLAGLSFVAWLAWRLLTDAGDWGTDQRREPPGPATGALMQWLNPKAWIASLAGLGLFTAGRESVDIALFTLVWGSVCLASAIGWAWLGGHARGWLSCEARRRVLQRLLAALLIFSGALMLL
ncbi:MULTISPECIES: LysE family translocator [unclassified Halomonas]|jgi:threonine/homoserine/homoserine lactone efflux protein|uniref:LysE family translocator n=1 Tax=unclassified Halomonas TaxID=2609666 RepID=UPI0005FA3F38|nr:MULTISPECIES: LysE family translocator [unclassified Halomonas]MBR9879568.1 LysE family translocator [Gammaproteobacteria bacterium]KJZ08068.1 hypothetical protein TW86_16665 [Halomonas sp. S2151]MAR72096.1 LysE family translocator [Halomonas sp.]MBY6110065.1 LysE family translocator [Halomonas sp. DP1Y21-3]MCJ8285756.1 LysE family translocator [Halomonas sp.]